MNKFLNRVSNRWRDSRLWQNSEASTGVNKEYKRSNNDAGMTVQSRLNVMNQVRLGNYFKMGVKIYRTGRNLFCSRPLQDNIPWHTYIIRWSTLVRKVPYFVKKKIIIKHTHTNKKSSRWPIYVINSVDNTKLPSYTLLPTQHHRFFRNLPPWYPKHWNSVTGSRKRKDDECG